MCGSVGLLAGAVGPVPTTVPGIDCPPTTEAGASTIVTAGRRSIHDADVALARGSELDGRGRAVVGVGLRVTGELVVVVTSPAAVAALPIATGSTTTTLDAINAARAARAADRRLFEQNIND